MDDKSFFDLLYQQWSKTTGAENMFWMSEKVDAGDIVWEVYAVDQEQEQHFVASFLSEEDADFVSGVHGCVADLIRRLHTALDEADRLDIEKDELIGRVADLELEALDHRGIVTDLEMQNSDLLFQLDEVGR